MIKTCLGARKLFLRKLGRAEVRTAGEGSEEKKGKSWGKLNFPFKLNKIKVYYNTNWDAGNKREGMYSESVNFSIEYVFRSFSNMKGNMEHN